MALPRDARLALVAVLVAAAGVRFWAIDYGLPLARAHPDEPVVARIAVDIARGDLNPRFFNYPTLFMYATAVLYRGYCGVATLAGRSESAAACLATWPVHWEPFLLLARALSALSGVGTVWLVYLVGRRLFDRATGIVAALFLAFVFLHVRDSHFGVTDVTMTMLVVAAVLAVTRAHDQGGAMAFAWAGLLAGLATSTKYNGLLLVFTVLASQVLALRDGGRLDLRVPIFVAAMTCGFLVGTPFAVVEPTRFWADASGEAAHLARGHGTSQGVGWIHHLVVSLRYGMSLPLLGAALIGIPWMCARTGRRAILLLAFPVVYYAVAGRGYTVFARYMVPVIPFLCVSAAWAVGRVAALIERAVAPGRRIAIGGALALGLVLPSAVHVARFNRLLERTDSRVIASDWIAAQVPAGASVYLGGGRYGEPDLSRRGMPAPYRMWEFSEARQMFDTPTGLTTQWPEWIVIQESPLGDYSRTPAAVRDGLSRYDLRRAVHAVDMRAPHVYDQQDAFFLPLAGLKGIARPGPNIYVYQRR